VSGYVFPVTERELQFTTALLSCGADLDDLEGCLSLGVPGGTRPIPATFNYAKFKAHKAKLLAHLEAADYFDVYYANIRATPIDFQLTEKAALWVGEFYQWLLRQQPYNAL